MTHEKDAAAEARREKYGHLSPPVRIEDTVISQETQPARDSKGERDTDFTIGIGYSGTAM